MVSIGPQAFEMFTRSGLANDQLAHIWELSDMDLDSQLSQQEFLVAMYLITLTRAVRRPSPTHISIYGKYATRVTFPQLFSRYMINTNVLYITGQCHPRFYSRRVSCVGLVHPSWPRQG